MNLSSKTITVLLFVFNLVFAICGMIVLICGVLVEVNWRYPDVDPLLRIGIIVTGGITFVMALFGCFHAIRKNLDVSTAFVIIISSIIVLQIALSIYLSVLRNRIERYEVIHDYEKLFNEYYKDGYAHDWVNSVQENMNCCGIDGPDDFLKTFNATEFYHWSCCQAENGHKSGECTSSEVHQRGCRDYVFDMLMSKQELLGGIIYGITAVEVIGIIFAIFLARTIREHERRLMIH